MDDTDIDIRGLLEVMRRRLGLIAITAAMSVALALAVLFALTPTYTATALVLHDPNGTDLLQPETRNATNSAADSARIEGAVELMRSDHLLLKLVDAQNLTADPEFGQTDHPLLDALHRPATREPDATETRNHTLAKLRSAISVQRRGATHLIAVQARALSPARAAELANALAQVFIDDQLDTKIQSLLAARDALEARMLETGNAIRQSEQRAAGAITAEAAETAPLRHYADLARNLNQVLLARAQHLDIQAGIQIADSRVVSPALPPSASNSPSPSRTLALAGLLGIAAGVALAFIREGLVGGFVSADQLAALTRSRTAATIPRQRLITDDEPLADLMVTRPLSAFPEAIRRLQAATDLALANRQRRDGGDIVVVTSTLPGEGKTSTALALARSYALAGRKALLIDCDLHKPDIHHQLSLAPSEGLLDLLDRPDADIDVDAIVARDRLTGVAAIVGARHGDVPAKQMLGSTKFTRLLHAARNAYDIIVVDTPPADAAAGALYVAPHADVVLFVSHWASTPQRAARTALAGLRDYATSGAILLGVLNHQEDPPAADQHRYRNYRAVAT